MVTLEKINPFWDDEYKNLNYSNESFNNHLDISRWAYQGYNINRLTGDMCDMRKPQPSWNQKFIDYFTQLGWKDIGTSYYRMNTATVLPMHSDTYKKYIEKFNIVTKTESIRRAVVFLEDWSSGHYLEVNSQPILNWSKGDYVVWEYRTPHMAANLGTSPRYTLQITGHIN